MPKSAGKHKHNRLNDLQIRKLSVKGRYGDGQGLNLVVTASGSKQWVLRTMVNGKRKDIGLGGYPTVTCLLYTSPSPRDQRGSRMPSSA